MYAKLDKDAFTPSDYCAMGYNMYFEDYRPSTINKEIRESFANKYGLKDSDIVYINPCYDIGDFYKLTAKLDQLHKEKAGVEAFLKDHGLTADKINADELPDKYPHRKTGICGSDPLLISQLENEIKEVEAEQDEISK